MRVWLTVIAMGCVAWALAQEFRDGSQLLLLDPVSEVIVGHGEIRAGTLELSLTSGGRAVVLLVIQPDGTVQRYRGSIERDGRVFVEASEERLELRALLEQAGLAVRFTQVDGDALPEPPARAEPGAAGATPASEAGEAGE